MFSFDQGIVRCNDRMQIFTGQVFLIRDITQIKLMMTPFIIRSNEGEISEHGKCSSEGRYERYKAIIFE